MSQLAASGLRGAVRVVGSTTAHRLLIPSLCRPTKEQSTEGDAENALSGARYSLTGQNPASLRLFDVPPTAIPESISMLLRHNVNVPAQLLLTQLEWNAVLNDDALPMELRQRAALEHEQLQRCASRGWTLSPERASSILTEFHIWCSMVVPHAMHTADRSTGGLLTEAMNKFHSTSDKEILPLARKVDKVLKLLKSGELDRARLLAQRIDDEAARWSRNLEVIRLDIENHLSARAALTSKLGLFAIGTGALNSVAYFSGSNSNFFDAMWTSGVLLWKAIRQWVGGWEYQQFIRDHYRVEMIRMKMINSMQTSLDNALFAKECNIKAFVPSTLKHTCVEYPPSPDMSTSSAEQSMALMKEAMSGINFGETASSMEERRLQTARARLGVLDALRAEQQRDLELLERSASGNSPTLE